MINMLAVLTCGVLAIVLGSFWYSPAGFGNPWMKEVGITQAQMEEAKKKGVSAMWKSYLIGFVSALLTAYVLAYFSKYAGAADALGGAQLGFWVWLGFFATTSSGSVTWEGKSWKWWIITNGYNLVLLLAMGIILATWK